MNLITNFDRLFKEKAGLYPRRYCISAESADYTYNEVYKRSNQLAKLIYDSFGTNKTKIVAILVEDLSTLSFMVVSLLRVDASFLFLDPQLERGMIEEILQNNEANLLVTEKQLSLEDSPWNVPALLIDEMEFHGDVDFPSETRINNSFKIYTSKTNGYTENIIRAEALGEAFDLFDGIAPSMESDKICFAGRIPLSEFIVELLHAFTRGKQVILCPKNPKTYFADEDKFSMDFSLFYFGSYSSEIDPYNKYNLLVESVKHGDQHGYTAVWTPERHFNEFGGLFPNPSVLGAAMAMITSQVQLRAGSIVSPLHHSIRIAEDWSIIDNLSKGRAALSFASGWQCDDFVFYPDRYEKRHQQMMEQIEEVQHLWKGGSMELKNGLGKDISIQVFPKPVQTELPIWVTVSGKTETFIDAGKIGANILTHLLWQNSSDLKEKIAAYRLSLKDNGFDPSSGIVSVMLHTFVGDSDDDVKEIVRNPLKEYIKSSVHLIEAMTRSNDVARKDTVGRYGNVSDKIPDHLLEELLEIAFNRFFEEAALLGSPTKCHKLLQKLRDYGVNELACLIDFGLDQDTILKGLDHLTKLKESYDFRITKKYHPTLLRTTQQMFDEMIEDKSLGKRLQSLRKIMLASSPDTTSTPDKHNMVELKYDFSNQKAFVEQVTKSDGGGVSIRDLSHVNSVIDEDF